MASNKKKTVVCILNWKHRYAKIAAAQQVKEGHDVFIFENESTEDPSPDTRGVRTFRSSENIGNSKARNVMLRLAIDRGYGYIGLLDGDIVPASGMFSFFRSKLTENDEIHTIYRHNAGKHTIEKLGKERQESCDIEMPYGYVFPSHCSLNRREVFESVMFPEDDPFDGPGWGGEDDLLGIMLKQSIPNYLCVHSKGTLYAHDYNHSIEQGCVDRNFFNKSMRRLIYARCFRICAPQQQRSWWYHQKKPSMIVRSDMIPIFSTWAPDLIPTPDKVMEIKDEDLTKSSLYKLLNQIDVCISNGAVRTNPFA